MTAYASFEYPLAVFYQQELSSSLDDGLARWDGFALSDEYWSTMMGVAHPLTLAPRVTPDWTTRTHDSYTFPDWSSFLFGHIIITPSRLALGNLLSNQTRTLEVANLFLEPQDWNSLTHDVTGLTFINAPAEFLESPPVPYVIPAFGSYTLQVAISADGPATIDGDIVLEFEDETVVIPVTGSRVIAWPYMPKADMGEQLTWKTDIIEAYDGTEQRAGIRLAPRQTFSMAHCLTFEEDRRLRGLLFDWLARVFAVPVWFEARHPSAPAAVGATVISVDPAYGDFRVDSLLMIWSANDVYDIVEIESIGASSITVKSELIHAYDESAWVTPCREAYAKSTPAAPRVENVLTEYSIEFVTLDNVDLSDIGTQATYKGRLYLNDCNLMDAATADGWSRTVAVVDNESGRVLQSSRVDRSRFLTMKMWDAPTMQEVWRVRGLLHWMNGNRRAFYIPTFREDAELASDIGAGSTQMRIRNIGYANFYQSRRPFGDVRLMKIDGSEITRRIIDAVEVDADEELLTLETAFSVAPIAVADVDQLQFAMLVRMSSDSAEFLHRRNGDATISASLITCKE